jgi:hypothetical protein
MLGNTAVDSAQTDPYNIDHNQIRVCSLNAATGLKSPIVFLMGIRALNEREQSVRLSDEEGWHALVIGRNATHRNASFAECLLAVRFGQSKLSNYGTR